jgi:hypothetical protein
MEGNRHRIIFMNDQRRVTSLLPCNDSSSRYLVPRQDLLIA